MSNMENIVIVDAVSTGYNLVEDTRRRGYRPTVVNMTSFGDGWAAKSRAVRPRLDGRCDFIDEQPAYEDTLRTVRNIDPIVILAGSEAGIELATRLAEDLRLPGNPTSILPQMKEKYAMHEALRKAGLRYIRGKLVSSPDEAADFYDELGAKRAVVKFNSGDASVGMRICASRGETADAVRSALAEGTDHYGHPVKSMLVQEMINGTEYVVNTASSAGAIRLTSVFRYNKTEYPDGRSVFRYAESIGELGIDEAALVRYAYKALQAIGIQYGSVHGEYIIDEKGPVLVEINCRPMGASMPAAFLDLLNGQHETDSHLSSYIDPAKFAEEAKKPYRAQCKLLSKNLSSSSCKNLLAYPILTIAPQLRSYYGASLPCITTGRIRKTENLNSYAGIVFLAHQDSRIVLHDAELLCKLEDRCPEMLYQTRPLVTSSQTAGTTVTDVKDIPGIFDFGETYTVFSESNADSGNIVNKKNYYDNVIFDRAPEPGWTLEESLSTLFILTRSMKKGCRIVLTQRALGVGGESVDYRTAALQLAGLKADAPLPEHPELVTGTVV